MGDQIGSAVDGTLYFINKKEYDRVVQSNVDPKVRAALLATFNRLNTIYMIARAGSGHIGTSFSSLDLVTWLLNFELKPEDVYFSSKGHDVPALYTAMIGRGDLDEELLHKLRRLNGLPGHPDVSIPGIATNTGSLGMGISKAKGMVVADRLRNKERRIFVLTGDGELQEGQFWESLSSAVNDSMSQITVIVDHNKIQSDTFVELVSDLGDLDAKLTAFGWHVQRIDGHSFEAIDDALSKAREAKHKPSVIIADTVKGKGVNKFQGDMFDPKSGTYPYHSGAPSAEDYKLAVNELVAAANELLELQHMEDLSLESFESSVAPGISNPSRIVPAYGDALVQCAAADDRIVALDADLVLDMGLIPFSREFPDRFVECGIAEQDMVSQAGALALNGFIPVVHSFACFLSSRPNEQIYNNATEKTKVIYVGALAGVIPAGPGHSHQCLHDIAALKGIPGITIVEPGSPEEVTELLDYCITQAIGPCYIRLFSLPYAPSFTASKDNLTFGRGRVLRSGADATIIAYGPALLNEAMAAAKELESQSVHVKVINLPWLNHIDTSWLNQVLSDGAPLLTLDNHTISGGQGEMIARAVAGKYLGKIAQLGVEGVPKCGTNDEVLQAHGVDRTSITENVIQLLAK